MTSTPVIYWFRNDLRIHDNPALNKAVELKRPVVPVFIFDNQWYQAQSSLGFPRVGQKRRQFMAETIIDLKNALQQKGNTLFVFEGDTVEILNALSNTLNTKDIFAQKEYAWEELTTEDRLKEAFNLNLYQGSMLYPPAQVNFDSKKSPFYFTKFKNKILEQPFVPIPANSPENIPAPDKVSLSSSLSQLNKFPGDNVSIPFKGGETEGLKAMEDYIKAKGPLHYDETRNHFQGDYFSSQLGSWLANGSLSPVLLYDKLNRLKEKYPEKESHIQSLIEQLIWRDNFRFLFIRYGHKFFTEKGLRKTQLDMYNDHEAFELWRNGNTGQPLIDALMHGLMETGFMSNRGRMLVSFYLSKEMKVNWQWGAAWFESALIDYDVYSNYGNWAYQSGRGTDSRVNRRFNISTQAKKLDSNGAYVQICL